jgi:bifunctional UDP-N-acetylglucosamine pyrophosphorylase/glucosamine-1-phosphate N-acetyltransferase
LKAVILASGKGTRLVPITETRPKHMIPIGGKPLLEHLINSIVASGIDDILIVVGYKKEIIQNYFNNGKNFNAHINYVIQSKALGTGHAVKIVKEYVGSKDFLVVNGDLLLTQKAVESVLKSYRKKPRTIIMGIAKVDHVEHYGVVLLEEDRVIELIEKPNKRKALSNLVNAGIYIFNDTIYEALENVKKSKREEFELTDAIRSLIKDGQEIRAAMIDSKDWLDVGYPWDVLEANKRVLSKIDHKVLGKIEDNAKIHGPVIVHEGAKIKSGSYIVGPVIIGSESIIGPNAYIRPYTSIGKNVRIGNSCEVKNSIIMDNSKIPHLSYIGDSIIGVGCNLGAGTITANVRLDESSIKLRVSNKTIDSRVKKLGAIIGDYAKTGINVSIMPGVRIGSNAWIGPSVTVYKDVPKKARML